VRFSAVCSSNTLTSFRSSSLMTAALPIATRQRKGRICYIKLCGQFAPACLSCHLVQAASLKDEVRIPYCAVRRLSAVYLPQHNATGNTQSLFVTLFAQINMSAALHSVICEIAKCVVVWYMLFFLKHMVTLRLLARCPQNASLGTPFTSARNTR
jgi:hypothetical protein